MSASTRSLGRLLRGAAAKPLKFSLVGVVNTAFSYGLYALLVYAGLAVPLASLLSLLAGILFSFATQSQLVFKQASAPTFLRYVLAWAFLYGFNQALVQGAMALGLNAYVAGAAATVPTVIISFFVLDRLVFRRRVPLPPL